MDDVVRLLVGDEVVEEVAARGVGQGLRPAAAAATQQPCIPIDCMSSRTGAPSCSSSSSSHALIDRMSSPLSQQDSECSVAAAAAGGAGGRAGERPGRGMLWWRACIAGEGDPASLPSPPSPPCRALLCLAPAPALPLACRRRRALWWSAALPQARAGCGRAGHIARPQPWTVQHPPWLLVLRKVQLGVRLVLCNVLRHLQVAAAAAAAPNQPAGSRQAPACSVVQGRRGRPHRWPCSSLPHASAPPACDT